MKVARQGEIAHEAANGGARCSLPTWSFRRKAVVNADAQRQCRKGQREGEEKTWCATSLARWNDPAAEKTMPLNLCAFGLIGPVL